jgi:hypothetical protein
MAQLIVYVAPGCLGCARAYQMVENLRATYHAEDVAEVVDATETDRELPSDLFALPSWYSNGVLVSLGNPPEEQLHAIVAERKLEQ